MPDLNMKGKNSDRALVHLDASIYFYLKWGGKWAIAGCKAVLLAFHHQYQTWPALLFQQPHIDNWPSWKLCKIACSNLQGWYVISKNSETEKCAFLELYFWKAGPQASDRRTIKGWTVFKIKVVFAATADQAISNKTSAVEKWLDKIKQWTPIVVQ